MRAMPRRAGNLALDPHLQQIDPHGAMPNLDVTQADAQDMVANLLNME